MWNFGLPYKLKQLIDLVAHYGNSQLDYERNAILAVSSLYGIDILEDNVAACRQRLFDVFEQQYNSLFKVAATDDCRIAVKYLLERLPVSYPANGRALSDDAVDVFLSVLTNGKVTGDKVGPHKDLLHRVSLRRCAAQGPICGTGSRLSLGFDGLPEPEERSVL
jgi:hypothetical protein